MAFVPAVTRMVHYVSYGSPNGEYASVCRAAVITEVVGETTHEGEQPAVSLCVINPTGLFFKENCYHSADHEPGSWHEPERVG
jgi:hypothetical protein